MSDSLSPDRKRLLYRATHRGFKEADLIIGHFAAAELPKMTNSEVEEFSHLLDVPDQDLYGWIIGREAAPADYSGPVLKKMQAFDVSAIVAPKSS